MKKLIKKISKIILPNKLFKMVESFWLIYKTKKILNLKYAYRYDRIRYTKYSDTKNTNSSIKLLGKIIREYHIIEKGLTQPETRLGFGSIVLNSLIDDCLKFHDLYELDEQMEQAIRVILEYDKFHDENEYKLDDSIISGILKIKKIANKLIPSKQLSISKIEYFSNVNDSFQNFSNSRASVRNYTSETISIDKITKAIDLAKNAPSVCNRQPWRTYTFANKEQIKKILEAQGGNRGFGHLSNKLIIIVSELGFFTKSYERNQAYIDGGIYTLNIAYALHNEKIATCILNCSFYPEKDIKLRKICGIKESEVFIAMIACGIPPENFKIANSKRNPQEKTNTILN